MEPRLLALYPLIFMLRKSISSLARGTSAFLAPQARAFFILESALLFAPGEKVVTSAQFMLDSESQLREAIQKMLDPKATPKAAAATDHAKMAAPVSQPTPAPIDTFVCPMPEHGNVQYDYPGECPVCGMTLIPGEATPATKPAPAAPSNEHAPGNH